MAKRKASAPEESTLSPAENYTVLARRYRPQQFGDLVGQEPVARALTNALQSNRVAHAYLFTGTRGVGKTSTARILAKALNCVRGPTPTPCGECDACRAIATGEDVDVIEIDGASNRGIDEIRELRRNAQYRPARARHKIYIIDEVHALSKDAFNALLKTLEEPPPHVKFIFATTDVHKVPLTILSRCQRFDFAGIGASRIAARLREVTAAEKMEVDDEALEWIARRAGGSMRDAQSLLDQLLAFGGEGEAGRLTIDQVHRLLGTAPDDRIAALAGAVLERDAKQALELLGQAADEGLQLGEFLDQLIEYWRDLMVVGCAGVQGRDVSVSAKHRPALERQAASRSLDTILAGLDILSATKARLRGSHHGRILMEMALVRLARLDNLVALSELLREGRGARGEGRGVGTSQPAAPARGTSQPAAPARGTSQPAAPARTITQGSTASRERQRPEGDSALSTQHSALSTGSSSLQPPASSLSLTNETLPQVWPQVLTQVGPMLASDLEKASSVVVGGPNTLVLRFPSQYNQNRDHCQEPARVARTEEALRKITGQGWKLRFEVVGGTAAAPPPATVDAESTPSRYRRQRIEASQEPLVKRAIEHLEAQIVRVDEGFGATPAESAEAPPETAAEET